MTPDEDSPFSIVPVKLPTGICLYNSFPPSSFVNPGVYPTTTETSLLNPHNSEGSLANKLTPFRLATSSLAFHIELFADLLHQRIQVPTTNKAAKPTLIGAYVLSDSHNQVFSLASSTNAIRKCFDQGVYNTTHISAIKTKFAQLTLTELGFPQDELLLLHIPGTINPSDNLTKPLSYMLHNRTPVLL